MNKRILTVIGLAVSTLTLASCSGSELVRAGREVKAYPLDFFINNAGIALNAGEASKLDLLIRPFTTKDVEVTYESSDPNIAGVSSDGYVFGLRPGICDINITMKTGPEDPDYPEKNKITKSARVYVTQSATFSDVQGQTITQLNYQKTNKLKSFKAKNYSIRKRNKEDVTISASYDNCDYLHYSNADTKEGRAGFIGYEIDYNVAGGSATETRYSWQLHCNEDYSTYIYHDNAQIRKYCEIDTSSYIGKDRLDACLDLLNGMFTNGKVILTQHLTLAAQSSLLAFFTDPQAASQIETETSNYGVYHDDNIDMVKFTLIEGNDDTADADDERLYGIPYGTSYTGVFKLDLLFLNGYVRVNKTYSNMDYTLDDGANYSYIRDEITSYQMESEVVVPRPDRTKYIEVTDVVDL